MFDPLSVCQSLLVPAIPHHVLNRVFFTSATRASGNITSTLANADFQRVQSRERLMAVKDALRKRGVLASLSRCMEHYEVKWSRGLPADTSRLLDDLPTSMQTEIALAICQPILQQVCTAPVCVHVCACLCACVCVCMCVCMCVHVCACVCVYARACMCVPMFLCECSLLSLTLLNPLLAPLSDAVFL